MARQSGRLISIEGVTGAGKSTALAQIRAHAPGCVVAGGYGSDTPTPTPFHFDLLRCIRRQLLRDEFLRIDWRAECLAVQAELLLAERTVIEPAVSRGGTVLYEHHQDSIVAYQAARLVEMNTELRIERAVREVRTMLQPFRAAREPDVRMFLAVAPSLASRRAANRDGVPLRRRRSRFTALVDQAYRVALRNAPGLLSFSDTQSLVSTLGAMVVQR